MQILNCRLKSQSIARVLIALVFTSFLSQSMPGASKTKIGALSFGTDSPGNWALDRNGSNTWDGTEIDRLYFWGSLQPGDIPVVGDWNGDGKMKMGIYQNGTWTLDYNGDGIWNGPDVDKVKSFGDSNFAPVVGDWNGDGKTKIGVYNSLTGTFLIDYDGSFVWDGEAVDRVAFWSVRPGSGEIAVIGDWNGDGKSKIGIYAAETGNWYLDYNGNYTWEDPNGPNGDKVVYWSLPGVPAHQKPVVGDWNGSGTTKLGVYSDGTWWIDYNGNFLADTPPVDKMTFFGGPGWTAKVGDWNAGGTTKIAAYIDGTWAIDMDGNYDWNPSPTGDALTSFGGSNYLPVVGAWDGPEIAVTTTPQTVSLLGGATQQFAGTVTGTTNTALTWRIAPTAAGTITSSGLYTAPTTAAYGRTISVIATSVADVRRSAAATATDLADFTVSQPAAVEVVAGGQKYSSVAVTPINNFSAPVSFSWSNQSLWPAGLSGTFAPDGTITIAAGTSISGGAYTLTFVASGGGISHAGGITVTVFQSLSVYAFTAPAAVPSPPQNSTTPVTATVTALVRGGKPPFTYAWSPLNQQHTSSRTSTNSFSFAPNNGGYSQVYFTVADSSIPVQTYNVGVALQVANTADFTVASSTFLNFVPGQFGTATVSTTTLGGFSGSVTFAWDPQTVWPAGLTATLPLAQTPPTSGTITVKSSSYTPAGAYWLKLNASSTTPVITHQVLIPVVIATSPDFTISAQPGSVSTGQSGVATSIVSVNGGYNSGVNLSVSGLPAGVSATFSPSTLSSSGAAILSLQTSSNTPVGIYPLTILGAGSRSTHIATLALTVASSAAATMTSPSDGNVLQGSSATFVWSTGSGVSLYQLSVTSPQGTATYVLPNTGSEPSQVVALPPPGQTVTAMLSSLVGATWQSLTYQYTTVAPSLINGDVSVVESPSSNTWYNIPNDAQSHTLGPWYAYHMQSGQTIPNSMVSGCKVGPTLPDSRILSASSSRALVCTGSGSCTFDNVLFNLSFSVPPNTYPVTYDLTCLVSGINVTKLGQVTVYDATPVITQIQQETPDVQGQPFYVTITGRNFGPQPGAVTVCASSSDPSTPCDQTHNQTADVTVCLPLYDPTQNAARRNENCPEARWSVSSIHVLVQPSNASIVGTYDVTVTTVGAGLGGSSAFGFLQADGTSTRATSGRKGTVSIQPPLPIMVFVIHGLGDTHTSMSNLAIDLRNNLTNGQVIDSDFDYQVTYYPACQTIEAIGRSLWTYVYGKAFGRRVAFVTHSMGGLVVRSMLAQGLVGGPPQVSVVGLATLGTPHLGYPYLSIDSAVQYTPTFGNMCAVQMQEMNSNLMDTNNPVFSDFLSNARGAFDLRQVNGKWFAASGSACAAPTRSVLGVETNGCRTGDQHNDGVVCEDSASLTFRQNNLPLLSPTQPWVDSLNLVTGAPGNFQHYPYLGPVIFNVLCPTISGAGSLSNPDVDSDLFKKLRTFLDAL